MKEVVIDCAILCYKRMVDTFPPGHVQGSDPIDKFKDHLATIEFNCQAFKSNDDQGSIYLAE